MGNGGSLWNYYKIIEILARLGFETKEEGDKILATPPTWRGDIEGEHDLVEEIVRMVGLLIYQK